MPSSLSIYFHIPFCSERCPYCDFYTLDRERTQGGWPERLPGALIRELDLHVARWGLGRDRAAGTIFFGGGTPSMLHPADIALLIAAAGERFALKPDAEITLEANPENVTLERAAAWRAAGVNRVSMGVQSLQPDELRALGRVHAPEQIAGAATALGEGGFENFSLDFIFGIPGQTVESLLDSLEQALTLGPAHISLYNLTVHHGTPLYRMVQRGEIDFPPEEEQCEMFHAARRMLTGRGWEHYEISNYARPGRRSCHNLAYWTGAEYLGMGPSAHSFMAGERFSTLANLGKYFEAIDADELPVIVDEGARRPAARANEMLLSGLRLLDGLDLTSFHAVTGVNLESARTAALATLRRDGLLAPPGPQLRLTEKGLLLSDHVVRELAF